jgi:DNA-binding NtrC family response regulator
MANEQHPKREEAIIKLNKMMNYPGRFPLLVIGDPGTGKTHWIKEAINEATEFKSKSFFVYGGLCDEQTLFWKDIFNKADNSYLIIEEIEKITGRSQDVLFDALSTTNGKYGFGEKDKTIRLIFTSTFPISKLRDDRRYLSAKFFDRISQFVVEFPGFDSTQTFVYQDFKATWDKMFEKNDTYKGKCPKSDDLIAWLEGEAHKMHGNFRDLDKIVINWNLYQQEGKTDSEILQIVKNEFRVLLHNPSQKVYEDNTFVFDEDSNYGDMLNDFRAKLKKWAMAANNNNLLSAAKMLKISHRTLERWK